MFSIRIEERGLYHLLFTFPVQDGEKEGNYSGSARFSRHQIDSHQTSDKTNQHAYCNAEEHHGYYVNHLAGASEKE